MSTPGSENQWTDTTFVNDVLLKCDISSTESQDLYKQWAQSGTYDKMISKPQDYSALAELTEAITGLFPNPKEKIFLDVGAGTGLTGLMLQEAGYEKMDALEPQTDLAKLARDKGIYRNIYEEFIGAERPLEIRNGTYDGIVCTGAFAPGHIPCSAVPEMVRITKSGGYVVICMREEYLSTVPEYIDRLEPLMKELEQQGKWRLITRKVYPNHFVNKNGLMFKYKIC